MSHAVKNPETHSNMTDTRYSLYLTDRPDDEMFYWIADVDSLAIAALITRNYEDGPVLVFSNSGLQFITHPSLVQW